MAIVIGSDLSTNGNPTLFNYLIAPFSNFLINKLPNSLRCHFHFRFGTDTIVIESLNPEIVCF